MSKKYYPAIFHPEEQGYSVIIPDLAGCYTQGDSMDEAYEMAEDAIGLYVEGMASLPIPSAPESIPVEKPDFITLIAYDPMAYRRKHDTKSVKKTLTIPSWLNEAAESAHLNFSSILQSGLKQQLHLD